MIESVKIINQRNEKLGEYLHQKSNSSIAKNTNILNNDSLSISTNTMIKNTNNTLMKFLYFLNNLI